MAGDAAAGIRAARGEIIVGGPGTVLARLRETIDASGIGTLATMIQTGTMNHEQTTASIGRLTELVLPRLSSYLPEIPAASLAG